MTDLNTLDYRALTGPIDVDALRRFRRENRSVGSVLGLIAAGLIAFGVGVIVSFVAGGLLGVFSPDATSFLPLAWVIAIVIGVAIGAGVLTLMIFSRRVQWVRRFRLGGFARANGLALTGGTADPRYPGAIFGVGSARSTFDCVRTTTGRFVEVGGYRYTTGDGRNRTTHTWTYLAIRLDHPLPNMVLDARANNGLFNTTNLPKSFSRSQVLHLEGDFDRYFTLYCPTDYERDALYVFTPDLMALLIDDAAGLDVEIVDDWFFAYSTGALDIADPVVAQRLFTIAARVGAKTVDRSERYRDERAAPTATTASAPGAAAFAPSSAPRGRRLRQRINVAAIVLFLGFVGVWLWMSFGH